MTAKKRVAGWKKDSNSTVQDVYWTFYDCKSIYLESDLLNLNTS